MLRVNFANHIIIKNTIHNFNGFFHFSCIASDENPKISSYTLDTQFNSLEDFFKSINEAQNTLNYLSGISTNTYYYSLEDMNDDMITSYKTACNITSNHRFAYGKSFEIPFVKSKTVKAINAIGTMYLTSLIKYLTILITNPKSEQETAKNILISS